MNMLYTPVPLPLSGAFGAAEGPTVPPPPPPPLRAATATTTTAATATATPTATAVGMGSAVASPHCVRGLPVSGRTVTAVIGLAKASTHRSSTEMHTGCGGLVMPGWPKAMASAALEAAS